MDKNNMLCSRCKKRLAVIYMTRMENGQTISEGLCLKCAKELGLKPVELFALDEGERDCPAP